MILVDANLLIYAVNSDLAQHEPARQWWQSALSGNTTVGIPWVVALAFLRITTHRRVFDRPLEHTVAVGYLDDWVQQSPVHLISPGPNHWNLLRTLILSAGTAGNLTTDAHIAALAIEHGFTVYSADYDFRRFKGLRHRNPLEASAK